MYRMQEHKSINSFCYEIVIHGIQKIPYPLLCIVFLSCFTKPEIVTKEILEIKSDELAIKRAMNILEKYGNTYRYIDRVVLRMQKKQDKY